MNPEVRAYFNSMVTGLVEALERGHKTTNEVYAQIRQLREEAEHADPAIRAEVQRVLSDWLITLGSK